MLVIVFAVTYDRATRYGPELDSHFQRLYALLARLARSRRDLAKTYDSERHRLRRDLHDSLGPMLATSVMRVDSVRKLVGRDQSAADAALVDMREETRAVLAQIRRLVYELRPTAVAPHDLVNALRLQADRFNQASGGALTVSVRCSGDPSTVPLDVEAAAYRIASEALTNVVRHARANHCDICVSITDRLTLEITDDGVGLNACGPREMDGLGLSSIRERTRELRGWCRFDRVYPHGTQVWVELPLYT